MLSDSRLSQSYTSQALNIVIHPLSYALLCLGRYANHTEIDTRYGSFTAPSEEWAMTELCGERGGEGEAETRREQNGKEEEPTVSNTLRTTVPVSFCDFHVTKNIIVLYSPTGLLYVRRRGPSSGRHHCHYVCIIFLCLFRCT